jgi:uncharacterized Fe-S cluster-containing MiaB family protein
LVEALSRIASLGRVVVGLSDEGMNPLQAPHNCEHCTGRFRQALAVFNQTRELEGLRALSCGCHKLWLAETQRV